MRWYTIKCETLNVLWCTISIMWCTLSGQCTGDSFKGIFVVYSFSRVMRLWAQWTIAIATLLKWLLLFGLSKERHILDHHAKAHIHEIWQISWNPADFTWNPPDFMKSAGFHVKSTHNLIKSDVSTKTIQFDECRRGAMTLDFMGEICWVSQVKSAGFRKTNCQEW